MANIIKIAGGAGGSNIISKTITANGTYNAASDNADGYNPVVVNVSGGGGLTLVSLANETHLKENQRTITISDNIITSPISQSTNCTGVVTIPLTNFNKEDFFVEYDIGTPSYTHNSFNARGFFSDTIPTNPWTADGGYGFVELVQSTTAKSGLMQRFTIPSDRQYFNIELGVTNFATLKIWE